MKKHLLKLTACLFAVVSVSLSIQAQTYMLDYAYKTGQTRTTWTGTTEDGWVDANSTYRFSRYSDETYTGEVMSYTMDVPNGTYNVEVFAAANLANWKGNVVDETLNGSEECTIMDVNGVELGIPFLHDGKSLPSEGMGTYTFNGVQVTDGSLKVTITNEIAAANWISAQIKSVKRIITADALVDGEDVTGFITNPDSWYGTRGWDILNGVHRSTNGNLGHGDLMEKWSDKATGVGVSGISQKIQLPVGKYTMTATVASRRLKSSLYAKSGDNILGETVLDNLDPHGGQSVQFTVKEAGEVEIGYQTTGASTGYSTGDGWFAADNFTMVYNEYNVEANITRLQGIINEAEAYTSEQLTTGCYNALQTAIADAKVVLDAAESPETLDEASVELEAAISVAEAVIPALADANAFITTCKDLADPANSRPNSDSDLNTFNEAITTAEADLDEAKTETEINSVIPILTAARNTYYANSKPAESDAYDMIEFVKNPKFEDGINHWTYNFDCTGYNQKIYTDDRSEEYRGKYLEAWKWESYKGTVSQVLTEMPNGVYLLKVAAFRDQLTTNSFNKDAVYVFANEDKTLVTATLGHYYYVATEVTNGNLEIGIKSEANVYRWMLMADVSLSYYGSTVTPEGLMLPYAKAEWEAAKNVAKIAYENKTYDAVKGVWRTSLGEALDATEPTTVADYELARSILMSAEQNKDMALNAYNKLTAETAFAKNLGGNVTKYEALLNSTTATLEEISAGTLFNELYVLNYTSTENNYSDASSLIGDIGTWDGDMVSNKGQHWSGDAATLYYEQSGAQWNSSSWDVYKEKKVTLPAGKYVLRVVGRSSADATLKLSVEGQIVQFPIGDTGYGVATDGTASFEDAATYANDDKGRGWQYRYIAFELETVKEVSIRVDGSSRKQRNWCGVCDAKLLAMATNVDLTMTDAGWATLILPFAAAVPEGLAAHTCETVGESDVLTLVDAMSLEANTPYILSGTAGNYTFTGFATNLEDTYTSGLLTGTFVETSAPVGSYVLQNNDGKVGFYQVEAGKQPTVKANRAYLTPVGAEANVLAFFFPGDDVTGIEATEVSDDTLVNVYTLAGVPVRMNVKMSEALQGLEKGIYIVGGVKKAVK